MASWEGAHTPFPYPLGSLWEASIRTPKTSGLRQSPSRGPKQGWGGEDLANYSPGSLFWGMPWAAGAPPPKVTVLLH